MDSERHADPPVGDDAPGTGPDPAAHAFDKGYWDRHWAQAPLPALARGVPRPHPYVEEETRGLPLGTALDAGCGTGTEAIWLAARGWRVTGADISPTALTTASDRAIAAGVQDRTAWTETDLTTWDPGRGWDLVLTSYAHPSMPHPEFYRRLADWVAPRGTLLIVGHLRHPGTTDHHPPHEATIALAEIVACLDPTAWRVETARESAREASTPASGPVRLHDAVVRAARRG